MSGAIKRNEVWTDEAYNSPKEFNAQLAQVLKTMQLIIAEGKNMSKSFSGGTGIKQLNDGIKQQNELITKSNSTKTKAISLEQQRQKVQTQTRNNFTKLLAQEEKEALVLEKSRQALNKNNRERKLAVIAAQAQKGSYEAITNALSANLIKYKKLSQTQRESTTTGKQLEATILRQRAALQSMDKRLGTSVRNVGNYKGAVLGAARSLAGAFGLTSGILILVNVMRKAFGTLREFTKENAVLAGVLGTTRDQVAELTEQSVALGSQYPVTATEVTKLQVSYARLGFTQAEIINLTEATIQGSIALNAELDKTATLVGAVVRAYDSLGTEDSGKIIDVLTLATQKSSLSFESLETALPKVAAAANAMGISLETVTSQLGIAQDATLDASISGTSLRNIYLELANSGMSLEEALAQINGSSNRLKASFELFGKRAAVVGLALANNTERTAEFEDALKNAGGTAEAVAKEQMATLDGSIKSFASSWEKLILGFRNSEGAWSKIIGSATQFIDTFSDERISRLNKYIELSTLGIWGLATNQQQALTELEKRISKSNAKQIQYTLDLHREELENGGKFEQAKLAILKKGLASKTAIEQKSAADKKKRDETAAMQAEVEQFAAAKEVSDKLAKEQKLLGDKLYEIKAEEKLKLNELGWEYVDDADKMIEAEIKAQEKAEQEEIERQRKKYETLKDFEDEAAKNREKARTEELKKDEEHEEAVKTVKIAAIDAVGAILAEAAFRKSNRIQVEIDELNAQRTTELANEELTQEERANIEAKYDKKEADLKTKKAKADKSAAITSVLINTAIGIVKTYANLGFPLAIAPSIALGIAGAAQAGIIAAQKIPQYAKGTENAPSGLAEIAEKGRELWVGKHGTQLVENRSFVNLQKGDIIKNNRETEQLLKQAELAGSIGYDSPQAKFDDAVMKELLRHNISTSKSQRREQRKTNRILGRIAAKEVSQMAVSQEYKNKFL